MARDAALILWATLRDRVVADVFALPAAINDLSLHVRESLSLDGAGVLVASGGQRRAVLGASDDRMHRLEQMQATFDEGPCMDAYHSGRFAGAPDLASAQARWPVFGPAAAAAGIGAAFSVPVQVGDIVLGALDCYRVRPGALTPTQISMAELSADIAADLILHAQMGAGADAVVEQMTLGDTAPESVEQASGMTAVRLGISIPRALELLREHARVHHLSLDDVAASVIAGRLHIEG